MLFVVPLQTALALFLACWCTQRMLRGRGFFRTAFYFPSVTSSVAITVLWLFLFSTSGAVNAALGWIGINGPNWFQDPRGLLHLALGGVGVDAAPAALADHDFLGVSWWDWLAGPSRRDVRVGADGRVHHVRHVHAAVHRRPEQHR